MAAYIKELQTKLGEETIGRKKEFLRQILKEVRVRGDARRAALLFPSR
jgi:thermostable 8-oxoguanine DNA glycosylase